MSCPGSNEVEDNGDCKLCREMIEELRANAEILRALRDEEMPPVVLRAPSRDRARRVIAIAAAFLVYALALWRNTASQHSSVPLTRPYQSALLPQQAAPLTVKMITSDPNIVIIWMIDAK
jgi:hypothetical protein